MGDATADLLPKLDSAAVKRLNWEVEKKLVAGHSSPSPATVQQTFWRKLEKNPNHKLNPNLPMLRIGTRPNREAPAIHLGQTDGPQTLQEFLVSSMQAAIAPPAKIKNRMDKNKKTVETPPATASPAAASKEATAKKKSQPATEENLFAEELVRIANDLAAENVVEEDIVSADRVHNYPSRLQDRENCTHHWADEFVMGVDGVAIKLVNATEPPNKTHSQPEKGKTPLLKRPLKVGSRYTEFKPPSNAVLSSLGQSLPQALRADLLNIHSCLQSSLAPSSHKSTLSAQNAFTRVWGSTSWLDNPQPGDREIILSRLVVEGRCKIVSALQYIKSYGTCLTLAGKIPPAKSATFERMVSGLRKRMTDPVEDVASRQRRAHNLTSLKIAAAAFHNMEKLGLWTPLKAQAWYCILLTGFWGRFRLSEILTKTQDVYLDETLLLLDVDLLQDDKGKDFIRIWLRREKAQSARGGSMIEIPSMPPSLSHLCPFKAMKRYIRMAQKIGLTRMDPLFTGQDGLAITTAKFEAEVKKAIAIFLPNDADLYRDLTNHSCRAGVPTMAQENDLFIPPEIMKGLGRWSSDAYLAYQKSFEAALKARRFVEEEIIANLSGKMLSQKLGKNSDQLPPVPKRPRFAPHSL